MAIRAIVAGIIFGIGKGVSIVSIMQIPRSIGKSVMVFDEFSSFTSDAFDALSYSLGSFKQGESRLQRPRDPLRTRREYIREIQNNRKAVGWAPSKALQAECAVYGHRWFYTPAAINKPAEGYCQYCGAKYE